MSSSLPFLVPVPCLALRKLRSLSVAFQEVAWIGLKSISLQGDPLEVECGGTGVGEKE